MVINNPKNKKFYTGICNQPMWNQLTEIMLTLYMMNLNENPNRNLVTQLFIMSEILFKLKHYTNITVLKFVYLDFFILMWLIQYVIGQR